MVHEASSTGAGWIALLPHSMKVPGLNPSLHVLPLCPSFLPQAKHTQESLDATLGMRVQGVFLHPGLETCPGCISQGVGTIIKLLPNGIQCVLFLSSS